MESVIVTIVFIFILIWAFRLEIGISKANEALSRLEEQLGSKKKEK